MTAPTKGLGKLQRTALWLLNRERSATPEDVVIWSLYGDMTTVFEDERDRPDPTSRYRPPQATRSQLVSARRSLADLHRRGIVGRYTYEGCGAQRHVAYCRPGEKEIERVPSSAIVEAAVLVALESEPAGTTIPLRRLSRRVQAAIGGGFSWKVTRVLWRLERRGVLRLETRLRPEWDYGGPDHRRRYILTVTRKATDCCLAGMNTCEATNAGAA